MRKRKSASSVSMRPTKYSPIRRRGKSMMSTAKIGSMRRSSRKQNVLDHNKDDKEIIRVIPIVAPVVLPKIFQTFLNRCSEVVELDLVPEDNGFVLGVRTTMRNYSCRLWMSTRPKSKHSPLMVKIFA